VNFCKKPQKVTTFKKIGWKASIHAVLRVVIFETKNAYKMTTILRVFIHAVLQHVSIMQNDNINDNIILWSYHAYAKQILTKS